MTGGFIAALWVIGAAKLALGLLALAVAYGRPRAPRLQRACRLAVLLAGVLCAVYGLANLVQHSLMALGVVDVPSGLGRTAMWWHLGLWDPWWILGGVLLVLTARAARPARPAAAPGGRSGRARRPARTPSPPSAAAT